MKRLTVILTAVCLLLTGCSFFNDTYVVESDYILPAGKEPVRDGIVNITTLSELREAIRSTVAAGKRTQTILFDSAYSGNPAEDLASACWQVRTEDALCAYCVENIAYELSQIVSYTEAQINISYSEGALPVNSIITMPYATDLNERIADAIKSGTSRLAILISRSALTEETMAAQFSDVYRQTPGLAPQEPKCSVTLYSGSGSQQLYEILLDTGLSEEEFARRKAALDSVMIRTDPEATDAKKIQTAADFLIKRCDPDAACTVYDALVSGAAGPEGISLGFVELCRRMGLECFIVYGQKDWKDHCWNIVRLDGRYYHVDLFNDPEKGFMKSDEDFWGEYRWNVNDYPKCEAKLESESGILPEPETSESITEARSASEVTELSHAEAAPLSNETDSDFELKQASFDDAKDQQETAPEPDVSQFPENLTDPSAILPDVELSPDTISVIRGDDSVP